MWQDEVRGSIGAEKRKESSDRERWWNDGEPERKGKTRESFCPLHRVC